MRAGLRPRARLHAVDLMRVITVVGVIAVHVVSFTNPPGNVPAGAVTMLLHANREVFVCLTALVLAYGYSDHGWRPGRLGRFWARRYWLVGVPYLVWSAVYLLADGGTLSPPLAWLHQLGWDLLSGAARYHLYFLLVTMQLYLVFPLLQQLIRATRGHHRALLGVSLVLQLALTGAIDGRLALPGLLGAWLAHPDALLPSYQLYVIAGMVMADHLEELSGWVRGHWPLVAAGVLVATAGAVASYLDGVYLGRLAPLEAAQVFQPAVVVESLAVILGLYGLGVLWAGRVRSGWASRLVGEGADASFGIYLAHPLVLQGVLALAAGVGLLDPLAQAPTRDRLSLGLLGIVPLVLALSWAPVRLARSGWLSVPIAGRRGRAPSRGGGWTAGGSGATAVASLVALVAFTHTSAAGFANLGRAFDDLPSPIVTAAPAPSPVSAHTAHPSAPAAPSTSPSSPAPPPTPQAGSTSTFQTITVGGMQRTYQVIRPNHPVAATLPAIVVLHGVDAGIDIEEQRDGFLSLASSGQAILVYPVGYGQSWNAGSCCGAAQAQDVDDVSFLSTVMGQVAATPGVDRGRIDLVGFSNGGRMAYELVCEKPVPLAAMAVVAALPDSGSCGAGPPLSLLQVAGTDDPEISAFQVDAQVATWRARDGCTSSFVDQSQSGLTTQRWGGCQGGADVELATYDGVAHIWPPGGDGAPPTGQLIWQFFTSRPGH